MSGRRSAAAVDAPAVQAGTRAAVGEGFFTRRFEVGFYYLFWIYTITSVGGLVVETLVSSPIDGVGKSRAGLLWGPFSPIYGVGAVLMTVVLEKLRDKSWLAIFLCAAFLGGAFELFAGTFWEHTFGFVAWDYSDQPFNVAGKTCLGIAVVWGVLGLLWMKLLLPVAIWIANLIPPSARKTVTAICFAFTLVDVAATFMAFGCWFDRQAGLPVDDPVKAFFAAHYGDAFMERRFQTISMYTQLATR